MFIFSCIVLFHGVIWFYIRRSKRQQVFLFNFFQLLSILAAASIFTVYPYAKLYHDLRGGMLKLICFVKVGRFVIGLIETHYDDFNFERLREAATHKERQLEAFFLMGFYNGKSTMTSYLHLYCVFSHGQFEQYVQFR